MNVNLKLIILHLDLQTGSNGCLLDNDTFLSSQLSNHNIDNGLRELLVSYLDLKPDWVKFQLVDVIYTADNISLIYGCIIPAMIQNHKGAWINLGDIHDKCVKRLAFQASQKLTN